MGIVTRKIQTLSDLYHNQLSTLYGIETDSRATLKKMAEAATSPAVRKELNTATRETESHAARLNEVFAVMNAKPDAMRCGCIDGLLRDCRDVMEHDTEANVRDASLVAMAQAIQQNEITRYQTAHAWAYSLNHDKAGLLLKQTLDEETASSVRLADLALQVNDSATRKLMR
jgi:ferritin-like metal-binding protein YciE